MVMQQQKKGKMSDANKNKQMRIEKAELKKKKLRVKNNFRQL
jgi:hypothetical protein